MKPTERNGKCHDHNHTKFLTFVYNVYSHNDLLKICFQINDRIIAPTSGTKRYGSILLREIYFLVISNRNG